MAQRDKVYPLAETFTSIQGEGVYTGTLMHFVRLAGCNVGKYMTPEQFDNNQAFRIHPADFKLATELQHSICRSVFGQHFLCDTNYHMAYRATAEEIMAAAGKVDHVCITGGEPFMHDLMPLLELPGGRQFHIETSGTKPIPVEIAQLAWITCSPKSGYLMENTPRVDEFKFVIAELSDIDRLHQFLDDNAVDDEKPIYLQPINNVTQVNGGAIDLVMACIERWPQFRLSAQLHKYLGVR